MELFGKTFQVAEITEYVAPITELAAGGFLDKVYKRIGQHGQERHENTDQHFARAQLIWMVIAIVLIGILVALLAVLTNMLMDFIKESTGGEFSNWSDIFSNLGDLEGLVGQFQNGGLEGLPIE